MGNDPRDGSARSPWQRQREALEQLAREGLRRRLPPARAAEESTLDLGTNDYLGLSRDPRVIEVGVRALRTWGAGAAASRLLRGNTSLHEELEASLARLKSAESALVFSSGYAANLGLLSALGERDDVIYCDRLDHASLVDGARLARAQVRFYRHGDVDHLERQLRRERSTTGARWIVTDSVFSMDGTLAPLPELLEVCRRHDAVLVVDDAHATGVLGPRGSGGLAHFGLRTEGVVQMGTLSKALGSQGGYVAGDRLLVEWLVQKARAFVYSTGLAPACVGAALEAIAIVEREPERRERGRMLLRRLREGLVERGWKVVGDEPAPMAAVVVGEAETALALADRLAGEGVLAPAIRPPTVPHGTSRVRIALRADDRDEDVERVLRAFGPA